MAATKPKGGTKEEEEEVSKEGKGGRRIRQVKLLLLCGKELKHFGFTYNTIQRNMNDDDGASRLHNIQSKYTYYIYIFTYIPSSYTYMMICL